MPFNPFSVLTSKIFGGLSIALLLVGAGMAVTIHSKNGTIDEQAATIQQKDQRIGQLEAFVLTQNAAVTAAHAEEERQKADFAQAVQEGQQAIAAVQPRIRIVRQTANNGCRTPPQIAGAGL